MIVYLYDATGAPIGMMYRTTSYAEGAFDVFWFEKNLHGDIVAIYDESGTKIATYTYTDAWGNHSVSYTNGGASTGAQYNPFRYRSYYYDTDLGLYYLQSRYYDPNTCRFINADGYVSTGQGLIGNNMFAYCNNNPVSNIDPNGESLIAAALILLGGAVLGGIAGGIIASISSEKQGEEASAEKIVKWVAVGTALGVAAFGLGLSIAAAPSIMMLGVSKAVFLGASSTSVVALGFLAYNVMPMILLPLLGIEMKGDSLKYSEPYNTQQPIFK